MPRLMYRYGDPVPHGWEQVWELANYFHKLNQTLRSQYTMKFFTDTNVSTGETLVEVRLWRRVTDESELLATCATPEHADGVLRMIIAELKDEVQAREHKRREQINEAARKIAASFTK